MDNTHCLSEFCDSCLWSLKTTFLQRRESLCPSFEKYETSCWTCFASFVLLMHLWQMCYILKNLNDDCDHRHQEVHLKRLPVLTEGAPVIISRAYQKLCNFFPQRTERRSLNTQRNDGRETSSQRKKSDWLIQSETGFNRTNSLNGRTKVNDDYTHKNMLKSTVFSQMDEETDSSLINRVSDWWWKEKAVKFSR